MTEAMGGNVLGQKAQAARRAFEARAMSPAKALRRALSRTADVLWDLALVTQGVSQEFLDQDGVIDSLGENDLLLLLDGPDGALGLATVDREVMTGLIEVQTIQQVTQLPVDDRPLTPTDAAMMAPLIDGTMMRLVENLDGHPLTPQLTGFRFGAMLEDPRTASLLLEASSYRMFRVAIDLALGRRRGDLQLIFPERIVSAETEGSDDHPGPHEQKMKLLPAQMHAVLTRVTIPLSMARNLRPGEVIPLPSNVVDGVELIAGDQRVVAKGKMGQLDGMRAVRLTWPELPAAGSSGASAGESATEGASEAFGLPAAAPEPSMAEQDASDMEEDLPDLPPLDGGGGDFDLEENDAGDDGSDLDDLDLGDFGSASLDIDIDTA